ncbi:hypothetical protein DY218_31470, partial [Streptomyces triticagri]
MTVPRDSSGWTHGPERAGKEDQLSPHGSRRAFLGAAAGLAVAAAGLGSAAHAQEAAPAGRG